MTPSTSTGERRTEMTMTQSDLTARIDEQLAATEGHTPGPWTAGGVPSWKYEHCCLEDQRNIYPPLGEAGPVAEVSGPENQALITAAPALRALLVESAARIRDLEAQLAAQAEALAGAGRADRLIREWFAEMVGVEKAEGEYRQDQTLGEALTQAHTRKLRAEIKLATYAAPGAAARFGLTESNADTLLGAQS